VEAAFPFAGWFGWRFGLIEEEIFVLQFPEPQKASLMTPFYDKHKATTLFTAKTPSRQEHLRKFNHLKSKNLCCSFAFLSHRHLAAVPSVWRLGGGLGFFVIYLQ
jgi:hypothetical protein